MPASAQPASSVRPRWEGIIFWCVIALVVMWSLVFISRSSYQIMGQRFFVLFDDAMISMTYARNLADGHGLVWNLGERVEGITNPLWTGVMAATHLLPVPTSKAGGVIQLIGAALLVANLFVIRRLAWAVGGSAVTAVAAVALTALYYPLAFWTLMGMEVGLLALMMSLAALWSLEVMRGDRSPAWVFVLLGIATLVRIDMAVPFIVVAAGLAWAVPERRREMVVYAAVMFGVFMGGQTLARWLYYGDVLPNTYYLKMTGYPVLFRAAHGLLVFGRWFAPYHAMVLACAVWGLAAGRSRMTVFIAVLVAAQMAYSIYVGGDAWEDMIGCNRFIAVVMPLVFVLAAAGVDAVRVRMSAASRRPVIGAVVCTGAVIACVVTANTMNLGEMVFAREGYPAEFNRELLERSLLIRYITAPDARVGVTCAGIIPYFTGRYCIDMLGKMDAKIAREPVRIPLDWASVVDYKPGHVKWDHEYSVGERRPDIIVHLIGEDRETLLPLVLEHYYPLNIPTNPQTGQEYGYFLRKDSRAVVWDRIDVNLGQ